MADVVVVGGGIAGVSVAAHLSETCQVVLIEAESGLARHATGRSAALFFGSYGHPAIRPLTRESAAFFENPPERHVDAPLLSERGALTLGRSGEAGVLHRLAAEINAGGGRAEIVEGDDLVQLCSTVKLAEYPLAIWEPDAADMDVASTHQVFVRWLRNNGGEIRTDAPLVGARRTASHWEIQAGPETIRAAVVVDAAGAWGDIVAERCAVEPIGLIPKRRTVFMTGAPALSEDWPLVVDRAHTFYFKPDGAQLLCSPADETPSEPADARPEEADIALAIERINTATNLGIRSVRSSWAGLRTFAPDGAMVIGFDPDVPTFFWLVGQGGTGIQTAPAAGRLAADLISSRGTDRPPSGLSPMRLRH